MTHKHTPGPWVISGSSIWNTETHRAIYASGCKPISKRDEEGQANARLIAAAPDLLEALELALANLKPKYSQDHIVVKKLTEAIAKANGE